MRGNDWMLFLRCLYLGVDVGVMVRETYLIKWVHNCIRLSLRCLVICVGG